MKEQLEKVRTHRQQYRSRRRKSQIPVVAIVGYTNAGKSTLLNRLTGSSVYVADQLFATLDPTTRRVELRGVLLVPVEMPDRARRLRKEIERRLRDRATFLRQETSSVEAMLREPEGPAAAAAQREHDAALKDPEVRARLREMEDRHWEAWMDQPVPALDGLTPRAAAATPLGRERLDALLRDFEYRNEERDPGERADFGRLRRALGLD